MFVIMPCKDEGVNMENLHQNDSWQIRANLEDCGFVKRDLKSR